MSSQAFATFSITRNDNTLTEDLVEFIDYNNLNLANPNAALRISKNGDIGIGLTRYDQAVDNIGANLHIKSKNNLKPIVLIATDTRSFTIDKDGNVGINNSSPTYELDVDGTVKAMAFIGSGASITNMSADNINAGTLGTGHLPQTIVITGSITASHGIMGSIGTTTDNTFNIKTNNADRITITNTGNVGIGLNNPGNKLHVLGDTRIEGNLIVNGTTTVIDTNTSTTEQLIITNDGTGPAVVINQTGAQPVIDIQDDGVSVLYIQDGGNVGIGKTNPGQKLDVNGSINATAFIGSGSSITSLSAGNITTGTLAVDRGGTGVTSSSGSGSVVLSSGATVTGFTATGTFNGIGTALSALNASNVSSGTLGVERIPNLDAGKITTGLFADARIPALATAKITSGIFDAARIPNLDAGKITTGIFADARIPALATAKITSGIFDAARIPNLDTLKITTGIFDIARIPNLDAGKITTGLFVDARIPNLDAGKITTGTINNARLPSAVSISGTITASDGIMNSIGTTSAASFNIKTNNTNKLTILSDGKVGVGNSNPTESLHVSGNARIEGNLIVNGTTTVIDTNTSTTEQLIITNDGTGPAVIINQTGAQPVIDIQDDGVSVLYIQDGGNVGIGKTNPGQKLDVNGTVNATSLITTGALSVGGVLTVSGNQYNQSNNVGVLDSSTGHASKSGTWYASTTDTAWSLLYHINNVGYIHANTSGVDISGSEEISFNVPSGKSHMFLNHMCWNNGGYFDVFGLVGSTWIWICRINNYSPNTANATEHSGIMMNEIGGVNRFTQVKLINRKGRIHLMGVGWTELKHGVTNGGFTGYLHWDNLVGSPNISGTFLLSSNASIRQNTTTTWTGDPGNGVGKIEYHSNRWYIVAGGNSTELVRIRRNNADQFVIDNTGTITIGSVPSDRVNSGVLNLSRIPNLDNGRLPTNISITSVTTSSNISVGGTITGNGAHRLFNNMGNNHSTYTDFNSVPNFGVWFIQGTGNSPGVNGASQYYSWNMGLGADYPWTGTSSYGVQFGIGRNVTSPYLCVRYKENNSLLSWQRISAGYADTAGGAGVNFTLNGKHALRGNDNWLRLNQDNAFTAGTYTPYKLRVDGGIYLSNDTNYLSYPTGSLRGSIQINGSGNASWRGYNIDGKVSFINDGSTGYGIYNEINGQFGLYGVFNSYTRLYHAATSRLETTGTGVAITGELTVTGDITAFYSDERLKTKTEDIKDVLPAIDRINVFKYKGNDLAESFGFSKELTHIGLSAQEVQKEYPELVDIAPFDRDENSLGKKSKSGENYLTLKYDRLVPILLQGIKELKDLNMQLSIRCDNLEQEVKILKEYKL